MIEKRTAYRTPALLAGAAMALATGGASAQTVGANAAVVNNVVMTTQAQPTPHRAVVKERVSLGNDIQTGRDSRLQVLLLDRTTFTLGGNSRIKVDRFVYDPARKSSAVGLSVARGTFRFMSSKALHSNPGQSSIGTPVGSIGIRGTIVEGAIGPDAIRIAAGEQGLGTYTADPATASLILLRGPGPNAQGEAPGAIDLTVGGTTTEVTAPGYALFVPGAGQPAIGPFLLSRGGSALLSDLLGLRGRGLDRVTDPLERNPVVDQYFERGEGQSFNPRPSPPGPVQPNP